VIPAQGTYGIGPENGSLMVHTRRAGLGAKAGHDLVLEATAWSGTVVVDHDQPRASSVRVTVDARSMEVREATGGLKPLTPSDHGEIRKNIDEKVLHTDRYPSITFRSTDVVPTEAHWAIHGELTIAETTRSTVLDAKIASGAEETTITARATIVQTAFGIKPYSAMMGVLKVRDSVDVHVVVTLPSA
jgi:polyisoprenoid-binding protein YceI